MNQKENIQDPSAGPFRGKIGRLISILYRKNLIYLNMALKPFNLTSAEQPFLMYLFRIDGVSQEELSAYLAIDKASTARVIQSLLEKGYVRKEKSLSDKRYNQIFLTDKAKLYRGQIIENVINWSDFLAEDLDEESAAIMISTLEKMVQKVEATNFKVLLKN